MAPHELGEDEDVHTLQRRVAAVQRAERGVCVFLRVVYPEFGSGL